MDQNRGFSLLELLVVLVIISLMTALILPRMGGSFTTIQLKSTAKKIASMLRYARNLSISEHVSTRALCEFEEGKIQLFVQRRGAHANSFPSNVTRGSEASRADIEDEEEHGLVQRFRLPKGVWFEKAVTLKGVETTDGFEFLFYPAGNSSGGEITLVNEKGRKYSVSVDFITGTVRVVEG